MPLPEEKRAQLDAIVQKMEAAGESEDFIRAAIQDFQSKSAVEQPMASHEPASTPLSALIPPGVLALNYARPAANAIAGKLATGAGASAMKMGGRLVGGVAGAAAGGAIGGPVSGFGGSFIGGAAGGKVGSAISNALKPVGKFVAAATDTAKPLPVRGPAGRMVAGALPAGRRLVNALSEAVPGVGQAGILSFLLDQQGDGAGLPQNGRSQSNAEVEYRRMIGDRGSDIELPAETGIDPRLAKQLLAELLRRSQ